MTEASRRWLVVMAKEPRLGRVKSRLARDIGWVRATAFYRTTLRHALGRLSADPRWSTVLAVTPDASVASALWPGHALRCGQGPGGLGERMGHLMTGLPPGAVVIVGSDIPSLAPRHIARAFAELGSNDVVLGPAEDGGYWLIGLRAGARRIDPFSGVAWSSENTMADTLKQLEGHSVGLVDRLSDADDGKAYGRLRARAARYVVRA
jgi:hypothetical protein